VLDLRDLTGSADDSNANAFELVIEQRAASTDRANLPRSDEGSSADSLHERSFAFAEDQHRGSCNVVFVEMGFVEEKNGDATIEELDGSARRWRKTGKHAQTTSRALRSNERVDLLGRGLSASSRGSFEENEVGWIRAHELARPSTNDAVEAVVDAQVNHALGAKLIEQALRRTCETREITIRRAEDSESHEEETSKARGSDVGARSSS
jgi:hypothetical protein